LFDFFAVIKPEKAETCKQFQ